MHEFIWQWPQITLLALWGFRLVWDAANEGEPIKRKYSAGVTLVDLLISAIITYFGGFWTVVRP